MNVCKREMLGFQRKCCQKFVKTPILVLAIGFGYRLSYKHSNEVISIVKEP